MITAVASTPEEYAPFAFVLIATSLASVVASLGMNLDILSQNSVRFAANNRRRLLASTSIIVTLTAALSAGGVISPIFAIALVGIWAGNAYGQIGKSVLVRDGKLGRHMIIDCGSALVAWAVYLTVPGVSADRASVSIASIFVAQAVFSYRPGSVFGGYGETRGIRILETQIAAVLVTNVDYVVASMLLPAELFSVYVLAFRLANSFSSQVLHVVVRLFIRDYEADAARAERQIRYRTGVATAAGVSCAGVMATYPVLVLVAHLAGDEWNRLPLVGAILLLGLPVRAITVIAGSAAIASHEERRLLGFESVRFVMILGGAFAGGLVGLSALAVGTTVAASVNCMIFNRVLLSALDLRPLRSVAVLGITTVIVGLLVFSYA